MAVIALTGVELGADNQFVTTAQFAVTAAEGAAVYLDANGEGDVADAANGAKREVVGILLQSATANRSGAIITGGRVFVSNTLVVGDTYVLATAGQVQLDSDRVAGQYSTICFVVVGVNEIEISITPVDAVKA